MDKGQVEMADVRITKDLLDVKKSILRCGKSQKNTTLVKSSWGPKEVCQSTRKKQFHRHLGVRTFFALR